MRTLLHAPRSRKRSIAAATLGALALVGSLLVATPAQALNDTGTGGVFTPATGRILDTAKGTGGFSTPMEAGKYRTIQVTGLAGVPDDGTVGAVSLNATVGTAPGNGTLFGRPDADTSRTSMLIYNGNTGEYVSNTAAIAVGADGTIQIMAETSARVILDVQGYYTANTDGTAAGGFVPVAGKRFVDTRSGLGAPKATIAPGKSVDVQVTGANGVPAGASGAVVNLIAINSTSSDGNLTPYATGSTKPQNSLHYTPSTTTSIQAQVGLSADGKMTIANASSTINLVIDLQGYFTAAGKTGASFTPGTGRAYDSRATGNTILAKNETRSIQIAGKAGVPVMGSGITAVVLTLIVAHGGSDGRAAVWADGAAKPDTTSINFQTDEIRTNTVTVPLGANGKISLNNVAEPTNYVIDVQGWYSDPQAPSISCPSPYSAGAWVKTVPAQPISCSIKLAPADTSNMTVDTWADGAYRSDTRSESAQFTASVAIEATAGQHEIEVVAFGAGGTELRTSYKFGLGDWANSTLTPSIQDGATVDDRPELEVSSVNDLIPSDAETLFQIRDSASNVIADSGWTSNVWEPDAGILSPGTAYTWSASVKAVSGGAQTASIVETPKWLVSTSGNYTDIGSENDPTDGSNESGTSGTRTGTGYNLSDCKWGSTANLYWSNAGGTTGKWKDAVNTGAARWNGAGVGVKITQTTKYGPNFTVTTANFGNTFTGQAPNFDVCNRGGYNKALPMKLNSYSGAAGNYSADDKAMVAAHEFGHNLGLRHTGNENTKCGSKMALMNPYDNIRGPCGAKKPQTGDKNGIKRQYNRK